jgi:hypothetical protein
MVLFIPYFLIYPIIISVIILLILVLYLVTLLTACLVNWKCKRRDHENGTVRAIEAQQYVGEVSVVNVDAEAHYVVDIGEVIADVDHSLRSAFVRPAVVANEV